MLNKFTDQNHDATYAVSTNAQLRLLALVIRDYSRSLEFGKIDFATFSTAKLAIRWGGAHPKRNCSSGSLTINAPSKWTP